MRYLFALLAVATVSTPVQAQRRIDWTQVALTSAMTVAGTADMLSTFACHNPDHCWEQNPAARLFYDPKNPAVLISAEVITVAGVALLGDAMKHSHSSFLRHTWWVPSMLFTSATLYVVNTNLQYLQRCGSSCR